MIVLDAGDARFNYRVGGVCVHQGRVLLLCWEPCDFWALPGGRPEMLETSRQALTREMEEEMDLHVEVGRLLWVVENFFMHEGWQFHELAFYYLMTLPRPCRFDDIDATFTGLDGDTPITFRWFPIDTLEAVLLYPAFLRSALADLPNSPVHLIHTDA
jgi:ADP-ribose pyrophosphatase YjhB (NUDIX family)